MKFSLAIVLLLLFASCTMPSYKVQQMSAQTAMKFEPTDAILLAPNENTFFINRVKEKLDLLPVQTVDIGDNLIYVPASRLTFEPESNVFSLLRKSTNYNYYVVVDTDKPKDELSTVNVVKTTEDQRSQANLVFRIFDISTGTLVLEQSCNGSDFKEKGTKPGVFSKTANGLLHKCMAKIVDDFVENSNELTER